MNASCCALELAAQSTKLMTETSSKLKKSGSKLSDIACSGVSQGRHFADLGGARIAPYECQFHQFRLELSGAIEFYDDAGNVDAGPMDAM